MLRGGQSEAALAALTSRTERRRQRGPGGAITHDPPFDVAPSR